MDAAGTIKIKRNDDQPFQQNGTYFVCVGFSGVCDPTQSSAAFAVTNGTTIVSFALSVPATGLREGRQLWVQRSLDGALASMDANVQSAIFDIVPTLPIGLEPTAGCRLDVDGDGLIKPETDGLLITRYLMGFRGDALLAGAISTSALRRSTSSIEGHLAATDFNIEGSSALGTTDGLILSRYLRGARNSTLAANVPTTTSLAAQLRIESLLNFTNGEDACSLPFMGLRSVSAADAVSGKISVLAGSSRVTQIGIATLPGFNSTDYSLTVIGGGEFGDISQSAGAWVVRAKTAALVPGASGWVRIRIVHLPTGLTTTKAYRVEATASTFTASSNVSAAGGALTTSSGSALVLSSNSLPTPLTATLTERPSLNGTVINVAFSGSALGRGMTMTLPTLNGASPVVAAQMDGVKAGSSLTAFGPLNMVPPYATNPDRLGFEWYAGDGFFISPRWQRWGYDGYRIPPGSAPSVDDTHNVAGTELIGDPGYGKAFEFTQARAFELNSVTPFPVSGTLDLGDYEPVLFVHGFLLGGTLGGGSGTWGKFPALLMQDAAVPGKKYVPFEFRWITNARFIDAGADLARAINLIKSKTGKSVHIVAHSFGGPLVRSVLQSLAEGMLPADLANARLSIASLVTLGSPHSGIAATPIIAGGNAVSLPTGRDTAGIAFCGQLTCHVVGESVFEDPSAAVQALRRISQVESQPGEYAGKLSQTLAALPPINIALGIGLTRDIGLNTFWDEGDYLISHSGQRLSPTYTSTNLNVRIPLKKAFVVGPGSATVWEKVLGTRRDPWPHDSVNSIESSQSPRKFGYLHSTSTGFYNGCAKGYGTCSPDGVDFGLEAAPSYECSDAATCQHAGFQLFKNLQLGRYCEFTEAGCPVSQFSDDFSGTSLDGLKWNEIRYGSGVVSVAGGFAHFGSKTVASTCGKFTFSGAGGIAVEARMAGSNALRDTHIELIDVATGDRIQGGDTNYAGNGLYSYGTGQFSFPQAGSGGSTAAFKEYRLTVNGSNFKLERGNTLSTITETRTITMPASVVGKTFFLRIGTGGPDYQPGDFDWVRVTGNAGTLAGTCN